MIKEDLIKEKLKPLFKGDLDNQAYAMGIYSALVIDKYFDTTIQQKLFDMYNIMYILPIFLYIIIEITKRLWYNIM